jgi:hypothetical protein
MLNVFLEEGYKWGGVDKFALFLRHIHISIN